MGPWNGQSYDYIDFESLLWAQDTVMGLVERWGNHPAVYAIEPVNEPWDKSDQWALKLFYRNVRHFMREKAPNLKFVFHDSFWNEPEYWDDLFTDDDRENVVVDNHFYVAWDAKSGTVEDVCKKYRDHMDMLSGHKYEVWVGEWSLGTDTCAYWLDNFNDSKSARTDACQWVECPHPYLHHPYAVDMDRSAHMQGPYGPNIWGVARYGMCPIDSDKFSSDDLRKIGQCILEAYNQNADAQIMWNFRTELEPRWSFIQAYDAGWIKQDMHHEEDRRMHKGWDHHQYYGDLHHHAREEEDHHEAHHHHGEEDLHHHGSEDLVHRRGYEEDRHREAEEAHLHAHDDQRHSFDAERSHHEELHHIIEDLPHHGSEDLPYHGSVDLPHHGSEDPLHHGSEELSAFGELHHLVL